MDSITLPSGAILKPGAVISYGIRMGNNGNQGKRDFDFFEKGIHTFKIPAEGKDLKDITKSSQKSIITNIDKTMEKLYELIPSEDIGVSSWCWYHQAEGSIKRSDNFLLEAIREKYDLNTIQRRRLSRTKLDGALISLKYTGTGKFNIYINVAFKKLVASILPESEHITKSVYSYDEFARVIDQVITAMNDLFTNESLDANAQNRSNLISLVHNMSASVKKNKKVKVLLGVESEINDVKDKSLIYAAANGYNSGYVKLFYAQNSFPKEVEDFKALTTLPSDMLVNILGGK